MKCIINGKIVTENEVLTGKVIRFDEVIRDIADKPEEGDEVIDAGGQYVIPGLVDIHVHGYLDHDTMDADPAGILAMAEGVAKNGVTAFCPTSMTSTLARLDEVFDAVRAARDGENEHGAAVLGVNCEGPFISPAKKGAQRADCIVRADAQWVLKNKDVIRLITIAPEVDGSLGAIKEITENSDVLVSMGHTSAKYDEAVKGFEAGVRHATHLFNAMTGLAHREPGCVGAILSDDRIGCEMICDTVHVHPALFRTVYRAKGDKLCLITDCMRAGGMEDGEYELGGQPVIKRGPLCTLLDGTIAGSVLRLNKAVCNFRKYAGTSMPEAVRVASLDPAREIGEDKVRGSLAVGKRSDMAIVDEDFEVARTIVGGRTVYQA